MERMQKPTSFIVMKTSIVGFWSGNLARRNHLSEICDTSVNFSEAMQFCYSHLSGNCRRKVLLKLFGETERMLNMKVSAVIFVNQGLFRWRIAFKN